MASNRALNWSEFNACLLMLWCADMASIMTLVSSSFRLGEFVNCSFWFAAACFAEHNAQPKHSFRRRLPPQSSLSSIDCLYRLNETVQ